jgi:hypothetical protein
MRVNAQCEQFNHADSDHEHGECYGIVVEPMPPMHDYAPPFPAVLVALAGRMVQIRRVPPGLRRPRPGRAARRTDELWFRFRLMRRGASFVAKILRGARPADLPIEQADRFEFAVNLKTAKAIGVTLPTATLLRADEVIE